MSVILHESPDLFDLGEAIDGRTKAEPLKQLPYGCYRTRLKQVLLIIKRNLS